MSTDEARVAELRSLVSAHLTTYYDTHYNLLRWIQALPGVSMDKIAARLRHHLLFRASSWDLDSIHKKEHGYHPLHESWPRSKCGKSGVIPNRVVHVEQTGLIDFDGMLENFSIAEMLKGRLFYIEEMLADIMKMEKETGHQASVIYVTDAEGIKYSKKMLYFVMNSLRGLAEALDEHYVEIFSTIVIVNAPSWANAIWTMVKPLLPERIKTKIKFLSSNWREEIHSIMDPAIGPTFWNNEEHHEFKQIMQRPSKVCGIKIPETPVTMEKVHVKVGKVHWIDYTLEKGDIIKFHISSNANFGFAIVRAENENDSDAFAMRQLYPLLSFVPGSQEVPTADSVTVAEPGVYKIWFSNERAWLSTATIEYSITIINNARL